MENKKSVFLISNLSKAFERPEPSNPLYSALHGPTANDSELIWKFHYNFANRKKKMLENPEVLQRWTSDALLYLYHHKRYCVNIEDEDEDDDSLFNEEKDASKMMYPRQLADVTKYETLEGIKNFLWNFMRLDKNKQYNAKVLKVE